MLIISYKRARYLRNALDSLCRQTVQPDEVIVVLKPSNDGSEGIVNEFASKLNINLLIQQGVGPINAYAQGIKYASGEILLFLDDDAIAEADWISKYTHLFDGNKKVGGITGLSLKAEVKGNNIILKEEPFYEEAYVEGLHRRPLKILEDYYEYMSTSGLGGVSRKLSESNK
ncbi:MAG: glycosyltransferase family A protein, partial [Candidatus Bathyarchaeia archaeon]